MIPILPVRQQQQNPSPSARLLSSDSVYFRYATRIPLAFLVFVVILIIPFTSIPSRISNSIHDAATGTLYHFHRQSAGDAPFIHFCTQHPIFTKRLSSDSLHSLLRSRQRLIGDKINNTIVAACANTARIHPRVLSSWLSLHGVLEVIVVHDSPSTAQSERALNTIEAVDRQGRIMYVNFMSDGSAKTKEKHSTSEYVNSLYNSSQLQQIFPSSSASVEESSSSQRKPLYVPPPPTHSQRWYRSRAFNLGAAMASGINLVLTDCRSMISVDALDIHTLNSDDEDTAMKKGKEALNIEANGTKPMSRFYVSIGHERAHASDMKPIELVYVSKTHFSQVHGFDERLDVLGFDIADLVDRLSQISTGLSWDTMNKRASHAIDFPGNALLAQQHRIVGVRTLESRAALIPELAFYAAAYAREQDENDTKAGWNGILQDGTQSILSLRSITFRALRSHIEKIDKHSRKLAMLVPAPRAEARLWIHATFGKHTIPSLIDGLPRKKRANVLLKAHRKLLHDHYGIPYKLLYVIEGGFAPYEMNAHSYYASSGNFSRGNISIPSALLRYNTSHTASVLPGVAVGKVQEHLTEIEKRIEGYSPMLLDVLWRKAKLLVVNIEADYSMELFRGVAWAISLAVSRNRALVIVGDLQGTPLVRLLDMNEISRVLYREYNVKLDIIGRPQLLNCSMESQSSCWRDDKTVTSSWDEYHIENGVSDLQDNASKHILLHVAGRDVLRWDERESLTAWQHQLEVHAFACISISADVKEVVREKGERGWNELLNRTALWVTRSSRDKNTMYAFASGYLKHLDQRKHHSTDHGHNNTSTSEQTPTVIPKHMDGLNNTKQVEGHEPDDTAQATGRENTAALLFTSDHAEMRGGTPDHVLNCVQNVADLWVVMQCKRIVFDSEETPLSWKGIDESILEWRNVQGYGRKGGIVHVRSADVGADVAFHEMEFMSDDDEEEFTPTAAITYEELLNNTSSNNTTMN